jgi:hypothetical protein
MAGVRGALGFCFGDGSGEVLMLLEGVLFVGVAGGDLLGGDMLPGVSSNLGFLLRLLNPTSPILGLGLFFLPWLLPVLGAGDSISRDLQRADCQARY